MTRNTGLLGCLVVLALVGMWFLGVPMSLGVLRIAAVGVLIGAFMREKDNALLLSPLFIIAAIVIIFYTLVPALVLLMLEPIKFVLNLSSLGKAEGYMESYTGSEGEAIVLSFGVLCLLGSLMVQRFVSGTGQANQKDLERISQGSIIWGLVGLAGGLSVFTAVYFGLGTDGLGGAGRVQWVFDQVLFAVQPVLCLAVVVVCAAIGRGHKKAWVPLGFLILFMISGLYFTHSAKYYVFIVLMGIFAYAVYAKPSLAQVVVLGGILGATLISSLAFSFVLRGSVMEHGIAHHVVRLGVLKVGLRQARTGYCFNNVLAESKAATTADRQNPVYFLGALVPRAIWADKPPLASAYEYGLKYCDEIAAKGSKVSPHSASITLLGEPLEQSGPPGLAVAMTLVVGGLGLLTWFGMRQGAAGAIFLGALSPWVMDFDQQFTMYLAHVIKAVLVLTPFLVIYIVRFRRGHHP